MNPDCYVLYNVLCLHLKCCTNDRPLVPLAHYDEANIVRFSVRSHQHPTDLSRRLTGSGWVTSGTKRMAVNYWLRLAVINMIRRGQLRSPFIWKSIFVERSSRAVNSLENYTVDRAPSSCRYSMTIYIFVQPFLYKQNRRVSRKVDSNPWPSLVLIFRDNNGLSLPVMVYISCM